MTKPELLERLALHRQALDETRRAILPDEGAPYVTADELGRSFAVAGAHPTARQHVDYALAHLALALDAADQPTQTPAQPWIGELPPAVDPAFRTTELRVKP